MWGVFASSQLESFAAVLGNQSNLGLKENVAKLLASFAMVGPMPGRKPIPRQNEKTAQAFLACAVSNLINQRGMLA